jgi:opacity protein-like surface antigen
MRIGTELLGVAAFLLTAAVAGAAEPVAVGGSIGANAQASPEGVGASTEGASDSGSGDSGGSKRAPEPRGFEHGLRFGVSVPFGKTGEANVLRSGDVSGMVGVRVPIWLDLGYRLDRSLWVGLAPELGLGTVGSDCKDDQECEWSDLRLSAEVIYSLSPNSSSNPWLGGGVGWESLRGSVTLTTTDPNSDQTVALRLRELLGGPQLFVQGGMGFDLGESLTVGPYVSASAGMFLLDGFDCPADLCPTDGSVDEKKLHAWVGLGVRGTNGP